MVISTKTMCNFNNLIFFVLGLLICASTGNSLKCYNCTTSDDKYGCDHPMVVERNDTESEKQVCLTIEFISSNRYGLRCWECTSELTANCLNPSPIAQVNIKERKNSENNKYVCRVVEYYNKRQKKTHISRSSVEEKDRSNNDACSKTRLAFYAQVDKCRTCTEDLCT